MIFNVKHCGGEEFPLFVWGNFYIGEDLESLSTCCIGGKNCMGVSKCCMGVMKKTNVAVGLRKSLWV